MEDKHIRSIINLQIYRAIMRRERKKTLLALTKLEGRAAQLEANAANLSSIIDTLLNDNQEKDEQIAKLSRALKKKEKMIDAMQCASALVQLHNS
jgi:alpha-D-ribose 1-methylphosphonate 5-triphosphate synthase subunit PhnG